MIDIQTKIHDHYTLEFKIGYKARRKSRISSFKLNTWVFVPHSLDINSTTYNRSDFYKDIRTNIRLITPVFLLRDIVDAKNAPLQKLEKAMKQLASSPTRTNIAEYEYQIKMFAAIYKSAIRDQLRYIYHLEQDDEKINLLQLFIADIARVTVAYRNLAGIIKTHTVVQENYNYYLFGDEFMSNITEKELFNLLRKYSTEKFKLYQAELFPMVYAFVDKEKEYKMQHQYPMVDQADKSRNSDLVFRLGALKKYIESDLFLNARKKRDGVVAEQVYYSLAAGLSMVFATAIAFSVQWQYGNFTMPLFVALVVSYMLKDRIKELTRFYFSNKISNKYFDNKTTISVKEKEIGMSKEGFDFIPEMNVPAEVLKHRNRIPLIQADNRHSREKIFLFKKMVQINREALDKATSYNIDGVVEIIRYNVLNMLRKADNPDFPLLTFGPNREIIQVNGNKNYYLNVVFQYHSDDEEKFVRYRIGINRSGVKSIQKMN
jgi:serine protease inhibitor ecotin